MVETVVHAAWIFSRFITRTTERMRPNLLIRTLSIITVKVIAMLYFQLKNELNWLMMEAVSAP